MKVIIAGSRKLPRGTDWRIVQTIIDGMAEKVSVTEVVSGCAMGVDKIGEGWARDRKIHVVQFPADWERHGKAAGPIRNAEMAAYGEVLFAIWDGESKGTRNMIKTMESLGKPVHLSIIGARMAIGGGL